MIYKILVGLLIAATAGLVFTGVIEIKVNPDKLSALPASLLSLSKDKSAFEKGRALMVSLKRRGEQFIITDKAKKLQLALIYVEQDAARLHQLASEEENATILIPQARSLIKSIELVRSRSEEAPIQSVAELKTESTTAFQDALSALGKLKDIHEQYQEIQQEFSRLTRSLEQNIGSLDLATDNNDEENIAGAQTGEDQNETSEEPTAEPTTADIPLKF